MGHKFSLFFCFQASNCENERFFSFGEIFQGLFIRGPWNFTHITGTFSFYPCFRDYLNLYLPVWILRELFTSWRVTLASWPRTLYPEWIQGTIFTRCLPESDREAPHPPPTWVTDYLCGYGGKTDHATVLCESILTAHAMCFHQCTVRPDATAPPLFPASVVAPQWTDLPFVPVSEVM